MIERVDGAEGELNVALGIDVVGDAEDDFAHVLHIAILIDNQDALGEHGLAERPDGVHDFARVAGIAFADRHDHEVVKDRLDGQIDVDNFWNGELHERQKNALDGLAHPGIFHGRLADDGGGVDGIAAMGDAGDVEDGIVVGQSVEAGVIAEGTLGAELVEADVAFEDNFRGGGDLQIDGLALDELDGLLAEEAGDDEFFYFWRGGDDGGKCGGGIGADGDGDLQDFT